MVNLYEVYQNCEKLLESSLEAREICAFSLNLDRNSITNWKDITISAKDYDTIIDNVNLRKTGKPLAYILGEWEFYSLPFKVNENVLIPRADTETLVEEAINLAQNGAKVLDICTGSGCIAITLAKSIKNSDVTAIDISEKALALAKENATLNNVNVNFLQGNALEHIDFPHKFDLIVSNPPYIPKKDIETLDIDVREHEPMLALEGGESGLIFYEEICKNFKKYLNINGIIILEYGINQHDDIVKILEKNNYKNIEIKKDLCGVYRIAIATI